MLRVAPCSLGWRGISRVWPSVHLMFVECASGVFSGVAAFLCDLSPPILAVLRLVTLFCMARAVLAHRSREQEGYQQRGHSQGGHSQGTFSIQQGGVSDEHV